MQWLAFLPNWTELSHVPIINTFASEGRKMIDKVIKEKSQLKHHEKAH